LEAIAQTVKSLVLSLAVVHGHINSGKRTSSFYVDNFLTANAVALSTIEERLNRDRWGRVEVSNSVCVGVLMFVDREAVDTMLTRLICCNEWQHRQ
jgi:chaperone required for assembly of F1-ATPase